MRICAVQFAGALGLPAHANARPRPSWRDCGVVRRESGQALFLRIVVRIVREAASGKNHLAKIFISYRRNDTRHITGRLCDAITAKVGPGKIFMDAESIAAGSDFREVIDQELDQARVVLAVIGNDWAGRYEIPDLDMPFAIPPVSFVIKEVIKRAAPEHRIQWEKDFVRHELTQAIEKNKTIIPILVDGATIPLDIVPTPLERLTRLQAVKLSHETFSFACDAILKTIKQLI